MSVFIAQLFPKNEVKNIPGASQAGINFCFSFIDAIQPEKIYAYQLNSENKELKFNFINNKINYIVYRKFPHRSIFKGLNVLMENLYIIKNIITHKENNIWFYNLTPQVIFVFIVLRLFFAKKCFVVMADFTPELFRNKVALLLLKKSSGVISLTSELKSLIGNNVPVIVKPGITGDDVKKFTHNEKIVKDKFLFSGSLSQYTGIELALETFSEFPSIHLYVSGRGASEFLVKEFSAKYSNIHYLGFLSIDEYIAVLNSVDFVLSLRDISLGKNLYNFPSKIVEYFTSQKIIISTKKYETLQDNTYFYCNYTKNELKELVQKVVSLPDDEIKTFQERSYTYALSMFSHSSWKESVCYLETKSI